MKEQTKNKLLRIAKSKLKVYCFGRDCIQVGGCLTQVEIKLLVEAGAKPCRVDSIKYIDNAIHSGVCYSRWMYFQPTKLVKGWCENAGSKLS